MLMRRFISMLVFMLATLQCTCLYSKDVLYPNVRHVAYLHKESKYFGNNYPSGFFI